MMLDCALGMLYLSKQKPPVVHRDLKLANLLVDKHWTVKVADFGVSRMLKDNEPKQMTKVGTLETCAPEVLKSGKYSLSSDVYSFGIMLFEILFEQVLYKNLTAFEVTTKVVNGMRPEIPKLAAVNIPPSIIKLMQSCWETVPEKRPVFDSVTKLLQQVIAEERTKNPTKIPIQEMSTTENAIVQ